MDPQPSQSTSLEQLAEDFLRRCRAGEKPALTEYTQAHPELAEEIRDVFPALAMLEAVGPADQPPTPRVGTAAAAPPQRLGEYRILREVARGGMGVVYEAEHEALGRHVALKVLPRQAVADSSRLHRFRREARAAARLHHSNIVPVFGVGEDQGIHYYAMQFIQGQALDQVLVELRQMQLARTVLVDPPGLAQGGLPKSVASHLVSAPLVSRPVTPVPSSQEGPAPALPAEPSTEPSYGPASPRAAPSGDLSAPAELTYFRNVARIGMQVADALAYAHGHGILHRDIKPSNLLVDLQGTVWLTDFGLAKEEGDQLTRTGDVVGTLRYMAPERFNGVSGTRSDVYSLGLTLYELITLQPAFEETDRARLIEQVMHKELSRLRRPGLAVPRDLETIVLKACAKDPTQRYQSASEMAEDLRLFLADRPIRARRAAAWERAWRWCRRNPAVAGLLAAVTSLVFLTLVGLSVGVMLLQRKQAEVVAERNSAEKAAAEARAISDFLTTDLLGEASPDRNRRDQGVTVVQLLDRAAGRIDGNPRFAEYPEAEAVIRLAIGNAYNKLGQPRAAAPHLRKVVAIRREVLGPRHPATLQAQEDLAWFLNESLRSFTEARDLSYETWQARREVLGENQRDTLDSMCTYAATLFATGEREQAIEISRECWQTCVRTLGPDDDGTLTRRGNLATHLLNVGKLEEAISHYEPLLKVRREKFGLDKVESLAVLNNLAVAYYRANRLDEADRLISEGVALMTRSHSPTHYHTLHLRWTRTRVLLDQGRLAEVEPEAREVLAQREKMLEANHESVGRSLLLLGRLLVEKGSLAEAVEAEKLLTRASDLFRKNYPAMTSLIGDSEGWLGAALLAQGRYAEAEKLLLDGHAKLCAAPDVPDRHRELIRQRIVRLYEEWNKPEKASAWRSRSADKPAAPKYK